MTSHIAGSSQTGWRRVPLESIGDCVRAQAAFYGTGGLLCLLSVVLPAWPGRNVAIVLTIGLIAITVAAVLALNASRAVPRQLCYVLVFVGSLLIALLLYAGAGGAASATYAGFYVWVGVYSFLFFSPSAASVQVVFALGCQLVALLAVGQGSVAPAQLSISAGTIVATAAVVAVLSSRMRALTITDGLTGLANRRAVDVVLQDRLSRDRGRPDVAVLTIDLDGFKSLNDSLGHAAGDRLLQEVAHLWTAELRRGDVLGRFGGDEFVAVLDDCDERRALQVADRLVAVVPPPVSACIGVVVAPGGTHPLPVEVAVILALADSALYAGKAQGPGSVVSLDWTKAAVDRCPAAGNNRAAASAVLA